MEEAWKLTERQKKEGTEVCNWRQGRGGGLLLEGIRKTERLGEKGKVKH